MLRFYDIDENYIQFLKKVDRQVPDVKYDSNNKFVCGVVFEINGIKYYAPISHKIVKQQTGILILDKGTPISSIKLSFMIPAFDEVLKCKNFKDIARQDASYAALLEAEYSYCSAHESDIKKKAMAVYKIGCNKKHKLNYVCCNFKKLEEYYLQYKELLQ